jgi:hypothetical protein
MFELAPAKFLNWTKGEHQMVNVGCIRSSVNRLHCLRYETLSGKFDLYKDVYEQYVGHAQVCFRPNQA